MYSVRKKWRILFNILILQLLGIFFFAKGFFPYKASLSGLSTINDLPPLPNGEKALPLKPKFDRLVFMLIDALRRFANIAHILNVNYEYIFYSIDIHYQRFRIWKEFWNEVRPKVNKRDSVDFII